MKFNIKFNRYEMSGAFGDIGTDFPLIMGMISVAQLDVASVLGMYGLMQIISGIMYGIPMPVQPLKAMAIMVIASKATGGQLYAAGLVIGLMMLFLSTTGIINFIARIVPKAVVRGIQLALGIQLASLALKDYIGSEGYLGYALAGVCFIIALVCLCKKFPGALIIIALGLLFGLFKGAGQGVAISFSLPHFHSISYSDLWFGFSVLALTQLPLSLGNSILATHQTVLDLFPDKKLTVKKISLTYSVMNLVNPFFGGVPVCHGSGGLVGHYAFGARTGGSVIIYGLFYLSLGLFFSQSLISIINFFPKPMLGVVLTIEGLILMNLVKELKGIKNDFLVACLVALIAISLPLGYFWGLIIGCLVKYCFDKSKLII